MAWAPPEGRPSKPTSLGGQRPHDLDPRKSRPTGGETLKGIILAGGSGTRLRPVTSVVSKHLLPIYDKPMVYYPLSTLMLAGIREFLIISTPRDLPLYQELLGDGSRLGLTIQYREQARPEGIAQALLIADDFVDEEGAVLILGDNVFYGHNLGQYLSDAILKNRGATVFGYYVKDPQRYGVVTLDPDGRVTGLEEKPKNPQSNYAVTGLYVYGPDVVKMARRLRPSARDELEITALNQAYLAAGKLDFVLLGRGIAWLDTGTYEALIEASSFIATIQQRQGLKVACLEEIAYRMSFIDLAALERLAADNQTDADRPYLTRIVAEERKRMALTVGRSKR